VKIPELLQNLYAAALAYAKIMVKIQTGDNRYQGILCENFFFEELSGALKEHRLRMQICGGKEK